MKIKLWEQKRIICAGHEEFLEKKITNEENGNILRLQDNIMDSIEDSSLR